MIDRKEYHKEYKKTPQYIKYLEDNREKQNEKLRKRRKENPNYRKEWGENNPTYYRDYQRSKKLKELELIIKEKRGNQ